MCGWSQLDSIYCSDNCGLTCRAPCARQILFFCDQNLAPLLAVPILNAVARTLPLLDGLPEDALEKTASLMTEQAFARRAVILKKNEAAHGLFFLIDGRLQAVDFTLDGREVGLFFIEPKQTFGELALADDGLQPEFVISVAQSRVAFLPANGARDLLARYPSVANGVLRRIAQRLRSVTDQRTLIALPNPMQRVCVQLVKLSTRHTDAGGTLNKLVLVRQIPTHQEIAIMVNTSRETVTRVFQVLVSKGVLQRAGSDVEVTDPQYLEDLAAGKIEPPKLA
ncbi:MAG: Crp/Fnr family transcriptional regulator [Comamonadaceae bacterium]|nr:MAG: Crp/Fnr family transcriptional regulator [Comamonadaceae bacterium]